MTETAKRVLLVLLLGLVVFAALSVYADFSSVSDRLAEFRWWGFAAALGLALTNYLLRFFRWSLYLRSAGLAVLWRPSLQIFIAGFALSVTPGKMGELIKCYFLRDLHDISVARSAPIVVAERVTDLAALLLLGLAGLLVYGFAETTVLTGLVLVGGGLMLLAWPRWATRGIHLFTSPSPLRRFRPKLLTFYEGLAFLVRPKPLALATALGVLAWLAECTGFYLILTAFPATEVPLGLAIPIFATTTIAGALSFLPGGLLVTEAAMTALLVRSASGIDEATAASATILTRLATLWFAVFLGLVALYTLRRTKNTAKRAEPPETAPG